MAILAAIDEDERSRIVARIGADLAETYDDDLVALHVLPKDDFDAHRESMQSIPEFQDSVDHIGGRVISSDGGESDRTGRGTSSNRW